MFVMSSNEIYHGSLGKHAFSDVRFDLQGETVVDLGSGAGFDVFLAARKAGQGGMAIGIDMSEV